MVSNLTNLTQITNVYGIVKFNSDVTQGILGHLMLVTFFFVLLMMFLRNYTLSESIVATSFLIFGVSIFFRLLELIPFSDVIILGIMTFASGAWLYIEKK